MPCSHCKNEYTPEGAPSTERTPSAVTGLCVGCFAEFEGCTWHETLPYYATLPAPGTDRENVLHAWVQGSAEREDWEAMAEEQPEASGECRRWAAPNPEPLPGALAAVANLYGIFV
jgi:hypothetical protein